MRFSSTHQPKPSRRRGGRPKSPATIERERIAAEKARAEAVTPWGVIPTGADGVTVYVMNDAPRKTVYFNRSIYLI